MKTFNDEMAALNYAVQTKKAMNKFANLVVHLNEDNFEEVKELLLSKGEKLDDYFKLDNDPYWNYLYYNPILEEWCTLMKTNSDKEITLEQFKRLINE